MDPLEDKPKLPVVNLGLMARWKQRLIDALVPVYAGTPFTKVELELAAQSITKILQPARKPVLADGLQIFSENVLYKTVYATLAQYIAGHILDTEQLTDLCGILTGNAYRLRAGQPIHPWDGQPEQEWVVARVRDLYPYTTPKGLRGQMVIFDILTGRPATRRIRQFFTDAGIRRLAVRLGAQKRFVRRLMHPRELGYMYIWLQLAAGLELKAMRYQETAALNKRNIRRMALRVQRTRKCPKDFRVACHFCHMSYGTCRLATHAILYVRGMCRNGHYGYVHPKQRNPTCLICQAKTWSKMHNVTEAYDEPRNEARSNEGSGGTGYNRLDERLADSKSKGDAVAAV